MCTAKAYTLLSVYTQERKGKPTLQSRQRGSSLVEILVAMVLSLIVSASAVLALSSSLGLNTGVLQYTLLSNELRKSLQLMSRDVRRAGYTAGAQWCLANALCLPGATIALPEAIGILDPLPLLETIELPTGITLSEAGDCFTFELDRDQDSTIGDGDYGGYRRTEVDGVGMLMTWMGQGSPNCSTFDDAWAAITNPSLVDISEFTVGDAESLDEIVSTDLLGNNTTQRMRRIRLQISGRLITNDEVNETLETTVDVRNDILM